MSRLWSMKYKRTAAGILGMLLLFVMLFSVTYIASEANHECRGEDCPICVCIQQCENTLHQMGNGIVLHPAIMINTAFILVSAFLFEYDAVKETLVSRKVRLNH